MEERPSAEMQAILERLAELYAAEGDLTLMPAAVGRQKAAERAKTWNRDLPQMAVEELTLTGGAGQPLACRLYRPEGAGPGTLLHLHGGGFAFGSLDSYETTSRLLALECNMAVLAPDYRLAPEHPYPAGLNDCRAAYAHILSGIAGLKSPVVVAGDSAGANLALALILAEQAEGRPAPDAGLLFYGVFDADFETESYRAFAAGPGLTRDRMMRYWEWYTPEAERSSPLVSPLKATDAALGALPPLLITACAIDPLRSEAAILHQRLTELGRQDIFHLHKGVVHGFMGMASGLAEARESFALAGRALGQLLPRS